MLMPENINPKNSIYYTGGKVLQLLQKRGSLTVLELYAEVKSKYGMSFPAMLLSLDWLYLINVATVTNKGEVILCI